MTTFKPGDIVVLKSGGVPMTVMSVAEDPEVTLVECTWMTDRQEVKEKTFEPVLLKFHTPPKKISVGIPGRGRRR